MIAGLALATILMEGVAGYPPVVVEGMLISGVGLLLLDVEQTYARDLAVPPLELDWGIASNFATGQRGRRPGALVVPRWRGCRPLHERRSPRPRRERVSLLPRFEPARWRGLVNATRSRTRRRRQWRSSIRVWA